MNSPVSPIGDDSPKWYYFGLVPPAGSDAPGGAEWVMRVSSRPDFRYRGLGNLAPRDEMPAIQESGGRGCGFRGARPDERDTGNARKPPRESDRLFPSHRPQRRGRKREERGGESDAGITRHSAHARRFYSNCKTARQN